MDKILGLHQLREFFLSQEVQDVVIERIQETEEFSDARDIALEALNKAGHKTVISVDLNRVLQEIRTGRQLT